MPCYQSTNLPSGFTTTGRTGYATESECNQACQEGACCEGTTCTVKPQCQCQCTTGGNCCGPDTATVGGVTGKVCRGGTKQECDQRGGTWTCGYACSADEKTGIALCSSAQLANPNLPVFKGVGTTCASVSCGCCCVNGVADATKNEQQCAASGGTWKPQCVDPPPASVVLTLSLTGYSQYLQRSPTTTSPGTWNFDFSCVSATYTLTPSGSYSYAFNSSGSIVPSALFYPSGSISGGNNTCGCAVPLFGGGVIDAVESAVATRDGYTQASQINCNAGAVTSGNSWVFELVPAGISYNTFPRSASVPGFCSGQFSVTGSVYGPGNVQCGTFTIGNPLP